MRHALTAVLGMTFTTLLSAQSPSFTGSYSASGGTAGPISLVLSQAGDKVTGTWNASGTTWQVNAVLGDEGSALGTVSAAAGGAYFAAEHAPEGLRVTLFEAGPDNRPDYSKSQSLVFLRQGAPAVGAAPQPGPLNPPPVAPQAAPTGGAPPPAGGAAGTQAFAGWNMRYAMPAGWQVGQDLGRVHMLASTTEAGVIFVGTGLYSSFDEMVADLGRLYQSMNLQAAPVEQPREQSLSGMRALTATYQGQDQAGRPVQSRYAAVLTPHQTGFAVLGMTTPEQFAKLAPVVERIAASLQASAPAVNQQAMAALAGKWMFYAGKADGVTSATGGASRSHEEFVTFDGRGNFAWESSTSVMVTTPSTTSGAGTAGGASSNADQGSYVVIGNTLVLKGRQGQMAFQLQMAGDRFTADGRTYVRSN